MLQNLADMPLTSLTSTGHAALTVLVDLGLPVALHATLKCPFLSHLWQVELLAGQEAFLSASVRLAPCPKRPQYMQCFAATFGVSEI